MNSKGGTLLIGIDDKAKVLGLKSDYSLLGKKRNKDGFELSLSQEISNRIGDEFFLYISIDFPTLENNEICRTHAKMSNKPVFVKENGDKSFYIRSGNSTRQLTTDKVFYYIKNRSLLLDLTILLRTIPTMIFGASPVFHGALVNAEMERIDFNRGTFSEEDEEKIAPGMRVEVQRN